MQIRTLTDDEKITEPGFYAISLERHHNQPCDGPSVTSGILRTMILEAPADVWAFHALNPHRWDRPTTAAMRQGAAMAAYIEGGEKAVLERFKVHAKDKPRRPTEQQLLAIEEGRGSKVALASVAYWSKVEASPSEWLDQSELDLILEMGAVLREDEGAALAMSGHPEITMAWQDEATGIWCLSRPDTVSFDGTASDYKKVAAGGRPFNYRLVDRRCADSGWYMQMAFAAEGLERLTGNWPGEVSIIAQSSAIPYHVIPRIIDDEALRFGQMRNRKAVRMFADCLESGHWPGPGEDVGAFQMSDWLRDTMLDEMEGEGIHA